MATVTYAEEPAADGLDVDTTVRCVRELGLQLSYVKRLVIEKTKADAELEKAHAHLGRLRERLAELLVEQLPQPAATKVGSRALTLAPNRLGER